MIKYISKINWLAVLLSLMFYSFLGWLWFTVLFADQYASTLDKSGLMPANPDPIYFYGPFLTSIPTILTMALLMATLNISTKKSAVEFALIIGLGFLVANTFNIAINPNIPHPMSYGLLVGAYQLIGVLVSCLIMVAMKKK